MTTPSQSDRIKALAEKLERLRDDLIKAREETYDLTNGEPDEDTPVAAQLTAVLEALDEAFGPIDDAVCAAHEAARKAA